MALGAAIVEAIRRRAVVKVFLEHEAFTPDRALDVDYVLAELIRRDVIGKCAERLARHYLLGFHGVKKINGEKIYLDVRRHVLISIGELFIPVAIIIIISYFLFLGRPFYAFQVAVIIVLSIALPPLLIDLQPLISYAIRSRENS